MNWINSIEKDFLNKNSKLVYYKKGDIIFNEGYVCDKIGYIEKGEVSIVTSTYAEKEETITYLKSNDTFGDILLFSSNNLYLGNAICEKDCIIRFFTKNNLEVLFKDSIILNNFLKEVTNKALTLKKENKLLKHKNIRDRIMHYLYEESLNLQSNTIEFNSVISFSKILSIPRPTLSKELSKLKDEKLINITKRGQRCFITLLKWFKIKYEAQKRAFLRFFFKS